LQLAGASARLTKDDRAKRSSFSKEFPMKRSLFLLILACGLSLLQQGCTVHWVVRNDVPTPAPTPIPFPNAYHIEVRVKEQIARLKLSLQNGSIDQETAYLLGQNAELVRQFAFEDRQPSNQTMDLTYSQTADLDNMLNDNAQFIDDAITHHQAWALYFQGDNYDYFSVASPYLYLTYLDHQSRVQESRIDAAVKSGTLTDAQAQELRNRIKIVRTAKRNYYRQNGRLDLSEDQVQQLTQMTQDNSQYLRFRTQGSHGRWNKDKFQSWKERNAGGFGQDNGHHWGWALNKQGPTNPVPTPVKPAPTAIQKPVPTPVPTKAPTPKPAVPTPVPTVASMKIIPPGQLNQFLVHNDQDVQRAIRFNHLGDDEAADLNKQLQAIHQKADDNMKLNQAKSVTPEQMAELSKMSSELHRSIQMGKRGGAMNRHGVGPNKGKGGPENKGSQGEDKGQKTDGDKKDKPTDSASTPSTTGGDNGNNKDQGKGNDEKKDKPADSASTPSTTGGDNGNNKDQGKGNDDKENKAGNNANASTGDGGDNGNGKDQGKGNDQH
jgi:hypothetical protein